MPHTIVKILSGDDFEEREKIPFGVLLMKNVEIVQLFVQVNILDMEQVRVNMRLKQLKKVK